jgi:hypothetical protein
VPPDQNSANKLYSSSIFFPLFQYNDLTTMVFKAVRCPKAFYPRLTAEAPKAGEFPRPCQGALSSKRPKADV